MLLDKFLPFADNCGVFNFYHYKSGQKLQKKIEKNKNIMQKINFGEGIMQIFWFILAGFLSGIFAGMGMGGGTFLIPILTIFLGVSQWLAQGINLLVFLPMSVVVIVIYARKKLIDFKHWWWVSLPACLVCLLGSFFAIKMPANVLKIVFACFIILVGIVQIVVLVLEKLKNSKLHKN